MPVTLGHLRLDVASLDRLVPFYTRVLGLRVHERASDDESHYAFLTDGEGMHHRLVLRQARDGDGRALPESTRLDHVAFEVASAEALLALVRRAEASGADVDLQEAGIAWQAYFHDPEGNRLEAYLDRREASGGRALWGGVQEGLARDALERAAQAG